MISVALIKTHSKHHSHLTRINSQILLNSSSHLSPNRILSGVMIMQNKHNPRNKILTCKTTLWTLLLSKIMWLTKQWYLSRYPFLTSASKVQLTPLNGKKRRKNSSFKKLNPHKWSLKKGPRIYFRKSLGKNHLIKALLTTINLE